MKMVGHTEITKLGTEANAVTAAKDKSAKLDAKGIHSNIHSSRHSDWEHWRDASAIYLRYKVSVIHMLGRKTSMFPIAVQKLIQQTIF
jgi:hypothetical protein